MATTPREMWAHRHETFGPGWIERYWTATGQAHRAIIVDALRRLQPWTRLVELGCNVGPNVRLILDAFPHVQVMGVDINPLAIGEARSRFDPARATFVCAPLEQVEVLGCDVVLTSYALTYLTRADIESLLLQRVWPTVRVGMVLAEPSGPFRLVEEAVESPEWVHDYGALLDSLDDAEIETVSVEPPVDRLNCVWQVRKVSCPWCDVGVPFRTVDLHVVACHGGVTWRQCEKDRVWGRLGGPPGPWWGVSRVPQPFWPSMFKPDGSYWGDDAPPRRDH